TVNAPELVAVPPSVVTLRVPDVAPAGTAVWIEVLEDTVKLALVPLNATAVAPVKFVPLMLTLVPTCPVAGVKPGAAGAFATVNAPELCAVPAPVVTLSGPVVAPAGTAVWMEVSEDTVKLALTPLNATAVAPVNLVPLMVTLVPTCPVAG